MLEAIGKHRDYFRKFWCAFCQLGGCILFCNVLLESQDIWRRLFAGFALNLALVGLAWVTIYDMEKRIRGLMDK
ncbi:MAG: hypothetical protein PVG85_01240 [Deltaproteobacteria bacterium]|jgi:hypothetical protein